ncbi:F0F1 ATP synthase subunit delta [Corticibacter populi]|uniref:ATP synthase subunit delta n=1 Tax=Corticibacter populi TaxID=1550736 RepID=A0A3M6QZG3_9BURK|nr:F0F1 ATP synthase subunit delta [Corticibacter populi]RMX08400.1 F0F1 ATP synthase subunit delta [Corticibacter populi]RZS35702.1 ATP synthase F1 subcomplex delta subunit [Corticibacter populi]
MAELATIARPYAEALFKATSGADAAAAQQWLDAFALIAADPDVERIANSPNVSRQQLLDLFAGAVKADLPATVRNLLSIVIDNGRLPALPQVAAQFHDLVNGREGAADAVVYSAYPISDAELDGLRQTLEKRFGRKLNLSVQLDESLIGGVRVVVGDEELDTSVKARLEQMKTALTA